PKIEKEIFKAFSASNIPLSLLHDNNIYLILIFVTYDYSKIIPTFTCDMVHRTVSKNFILSHIQYN
ncbi:hypothetical protein ACTQ31_15550, partial [Clostridium butyricum]|uniref:hypothetical protein n=1 Tax=Clostridium butyricum TaxID=1492 RepID=UPI003F8DF2DD